MLAACTTLETLVLYSYAVGRVAAIDLLHLLTACPSITELHLCESGIDDDAALLEGLACLPQLQVLKLFGRLCLSRAGAEVLQSRAHLPRLVELELGGGVDLGAGGGMAIAETLDRIVDSRLALRILTVSEDAFPAELEVQSFELPFEAKLEARGGGFRFEDPASMDCD